MENEDVADCRLKALPIADCQLPIERLWKLRDKQGHRNLFQLAIGNRQ
jgi:hypothetical protein